MIKDVLIPQKVGSYYIFPKTILGFDVCGKTEVTATKVRLHGESIVIEKFFKEKLEPGNQFTHDEKIVNAIRQIIEDAGHYDEIHTAISSSHVIFKQLKLPFLSYKKIKMVVNYEVEPLLPFSLDSAIIDFIITNQIEEEHSSEVMVAATLQEIVANQVKLFEDAGVSPSHISVDLLSLYSLYKMVPRYASLKDGVALIDVGFHATRVAYIRDGSLAFVRTLPKGLFSQAKLFAADYGITSQEAVELIIRFGVENPDDKSYNKIMEQIISQFWSDIKFTLQSFSTQPDQNNLIERIVLFGQGTKLPGIEVFVSSFLSIPTERFKIEGLFEHKKIQLKHAISVPQDNVLSLGIALPSDTIDRFNLYGIKTIVSDVSIVNKQLITSAVLTLSLFVLFFVHSFIQLGKLEHEIEASQQQAIEKLRSRFKTISSADDALYTAIGNAQQEVANDKALWSGFFAQEKHSLLEALLILHTVIDVDSEELGLRVDKISVSSANSTIMLDAEVNDWPALKKLEKDLRQSKYFSYVEEPTDRKFSIKLILAKKA